MKQNNFHNYSLGNTSIQQIAMLDMSHAKNIQITVQFKNYNEA